MLLFPPLKSVPQSVSESESEEFCFPISKHKNRISDTDSDTDSDSDTDTVLAAQDFVELFSEDFKLGGERVERVGVVEEDADHMA
jgi:hypothetical protein